MAGQQAIRQHKDIVTVEMAMSSDSPTLATIQRAHDRGFLENYIKLWLVHLNQALSLKRPLTETQIRMAAFEVAETYYTLKIADLAFLMRRIISGEFGEFYESLSIAKVLSFFREYFDERCNAAMERSQSDHGDYKARQDRLDFSNNPRRIFDGNSRSFNSKRKK